ncbi:hypothetical protein [Parasphingopyxis lamellibrachiae]|uniref:Uncharacterized protein n=1 Tax=Parasphingopyxis lamellibrachiae TaxID=680125 RepID=A0A3D9FEF5_9SPHN|nr:hypothetical protein [Parasphingopyxis lamellibrachiae]RED16169.1 hypothetical protein DFR46_1185 [Parasphingopyxis lamellibrachiae]
MSSMSFRVPLGLRLPVENILYVGVGDGREVEKLRSVDARSITLVEADFQHALRLADLADDTVRIVLRAVSADVTLRTFHRLSFSGLSSLRSPTGLLDVYPGLRTTATIPMKPLDPAELCESLELNQDAENWLILDAPGEAVGILERLRAAELLNCFSAVQLRNGYRELYAGEGLIKDGEAILKEAGYEVSIRPDSDPYRPFLEATIDREKKRLLAEIGRLRTKITAANTRDSELQAALSAAKSGHEEVKARITELKANSETLRNRVSELDSARTDSQSAIAKQVDRIAELEADREALNERISALDSALADAQSASTKQVDRIAELEADREALNERISKLDIALADAQSKNAKQAEDREKYESEMSEQLAAADRVRLASLNDLKYLQSKYENVRIEKDEQNELLAMVADQLERLVEGNPISDKSKQEDNGKSTSPKSSKAKKGRQI